MGVFTVMGLPYCPDTTLTKNRLKSGTYVMTIRAKIRIARNGRDAKYSFRMGRSKNRLEINRFIPTGGVE